MMIMKSSFCNSLLNFSSASVSRGSIVSLIYAATFIVTIIWAPHDLLPNRRMFYLLYFVIITIIYLAPLALRYVIFVCCVATANVIGQIVFTTINTDQTAIPWVLFGFKKYGILLC